LENEAKKQHALSWVISVLLISQLNGHGKQKRGVNDVMLIGWCC